MLKGLKREAIVAGVIVVATLALVFPLAYYVGGKTLGAYGDGGSLGDWYRSLLGAMANGDLAIWFFFVTPLLTVTVVRLGITLFRKI